MTIRENREIYNIKKSENETKKNNVYVEISLLPSSHADVFLAGKPSITFLKAFKKVMEGLVKNGCNRASSVASTNQKLSAGCPFVR